MSNKPAKQYLKQQVNYGGEWVSIGWLFLTLGDALAGRWLSGYEKAGNEIRHAY